YLSGLVSPRSRNPWIVSPDSVEEVVYLIAYLALLLDRLIKLLTITLQSLQSSGQTLNTFRDFQHSVDGCKRRLQGGEFLLESLAIAAQSVKYGLVESQEIGHEILKLPYRQRVSFFLLLLSKPFRCLNELLAESYSLYHIIKNFTYVVGFVEHLFAH